MYKLNFPVQYMDLFGFQTLYEEYNSATSAEEDVVRNKALVWKQDLRIVPLSAGIYLLCYLDRSNIGRCPGVSGGLLPFARP
jgi:hypothetical protein